MSKYYKRSASVEAISFDELVQHGIDSGGNIVNGMPWAFHYQGHPITHENDDCYLVPCISGSLKFNRGEMLVTCSDGQLFPMGLADFTINYQRAPLPEPAPSPEVFEDTVERLHTDIAHWKQNAHDADDALAIEQSLVRIKNDDIVRLEKRIAELESLLKDAFIYTCAVTTAITLIIMVFGGAMCHAL